MLWGCLTFHGPGMYCRIQGTMHAGLYLEILQRDLFDTMQAYDVDPKQMVFQQYNASCLTAKKVCQWLHAQGFSTLQWLAHFPDLNPIEHLWGIAQTPAQ